MLPDHFTPRFLLLREIDEPDRLIVSQEDCLDGLRASTHAKTCSHPDGAALSLPDHCWLKKIVTLQFSSELS
jgi:hypothetical protein